MSLSGTSQEPEEEIVTVKEEVEQWDCETILTTYSTLENHPSLIAPVQARARAFTRTAKRSSRGL